LWLLAGWQITMFARLPTAWAESCTTPLPPRLIEPFSITIVTPAPTSEPLVRLRLPPTM